MRVLKLSVSEWQREDEVSPIDRESRVRRPTPRPAPYFSAWDVDRAGPGAVASSWLRS
jgi:hypothetical protein